MSILKSVDGNWSSKRAAGISYMGVGLLMAIADQFTKFNIENFEVWLAVVTVGATTLGISVFEYFGNKNPINPQGTVDPTKPPGGPKT